MQIVPYHPRHGEAVAELYQRATQSLPHCRFMPSQQHIIAALAHPQPEHTQILVAEEGGLARAWAALLDRGADEDGRHEAELTALFVDGAAAGRLLVEAITSEARARGAQRLVAFPPDQLHNPITAYNAGWSGLSDRLTLIARLLARQGFTPFQRELLLEWRGEGAFPAPPAEPPGVSVTTRSGRHGATELAAQVAGEVAGTCEFSTLAAVSDDPAAQRWGYVWGLYVNKGMRRRGLGRFLMLRALAHLSALGCGGCWLTTDATNWPAQTLYLALGFEVVDASTCFRKDVAGNV
jgi:ribosomal protein S18 acetylase RimI-like enzyme